QLLEDGEISNAEFLALAFPDVTLHPIEDAADYDVEMGGNAGAAPKIYLFRIALKIVSPNATADQVAQMQRLNEAKKIRELMDYVIGLDDWCSRQRQAFDQPD